MTCFRVTAHHSPRNATIGSTHVALRAGADRPDGGDDLIVVTLPATDCGAGRLRLAERNADVRDCDGTAGGAAHGLIRHAVPGCRAVSRSSST